MNIVFVGASNFGMKCLQEVLNIPGITVVGILSDSKNIRISAKNTTISNARYADFGKIADTWGIPYYELSEEEKCTSAVPLLKQWKPDLMLISGWYRIIPKSIIELAKQGAVGLHGSMLPNYRGGAPLVWSIINGEDTGGISLFYLSEGMDEGDLVAQKSFKIKFNDTIATAYEKMEQCGLEILKEEFLKLASTGSLPRYQQPRLPVEKKAYWPMRTPEDGRIDWRWSVLQIYNFIRAQTDPYPGAFTYLDKQKIVILEAKIFDFIKTSGRPGEIVSFNQTGAYAGIIVSTFDNDSPLLITKIRLNGEILCGGEICSRLRLEKDSFFSDFE